MIVVGCEACCGGIRRWRTAVLKVGDGWRLGLWSDFEDCCGGISRCRTAVTVSGKRLK